MLKILLFILLFSSLTFAQNASKEDVEKGINFITTEVYTDKANLELLELYKNLRVADVSDGMDYVGLPDVGLVDPAIHADWRDTEKMSHVFRGIAITVRFVPTQQAAHPPDSADYSKWEGNFYNQFSAEPFTQIIRKGSAIIIDDDEYGDTGSIGSFNILAWYKAGAVGVVTDASSRDTDEIALERVPLYLRKKGRGIRPGRNEMESVNKPVVIGGVLVRPGDVVVADGDGVIVVPRRVAKDVATYAQMILDADKAGRRDLYKSMDRELDDTVK
jgi:4-hydroxy-4-methyl-2-oxoglutarate aldolase